MKGMTMHQPGLNVYQPEKACPGYTLFSPMTANTTYLIDMQGAIVHRWALPGPRIGSYGYLLDNGHLLVNLRTEAEPLSFGGRGSRLVELDWGGRVVWEYAEPMLHHDFCRMANGNTMVLAWERVPDEM